MFEALTILLEKLRWAGYFDGFSFTYGFFSPEEYRQWLTGAGLEPIRLEFIPKDMVYPDREAFASWIRTT